jgi:hypothetical protein
MISEFKNEFRWLSNFAPVKIKLGIGIFPSVEHAYQSMKTKDDTKWKVFCACEPSPAIVKKQSQQIKLRENWDEIKDLIMMLCLQQKYNQSPYKEKLIATGEEEIQEGNWWGDVYWGVDLKTGQGQNKLGKMIMQIREEINHDNT